MKPPTSRSEANRRTVSSGKAVPEVLLFIHAKTHTGVVVKRATAAILRVEVNKLADEFFDGNGSFNALRDRAADREGITKERT